MMRIALLFGIFSEEYYSEIINKSKGSVQYAADALQKSFLEGLASLNKDIEVVNLPYIGSYPKRYMDFYSPGGMFKYLAQNGNVVEGENVKFCNLFGIKMYDRYQKTKLALTKWAEKFPNENKTVVVYAIHTPFIKAAVEVKKKYHSSLKIVLIVPDLPEYMDDKKSVLQYLFRQKNQEILNTLYKEIDGYILLSKYMTERLPVGNKPWDVVEGIFNNVVDDIHVDLKRLTTKMIFYSGTLARRYGVMNLVEAFSKLSDVNFRLLICGAGDALEDIKTYAQNDSRILYKGQLPRVEVLKLQKSANLLVNPRTPEGDFTKYSFPSKTMEYLASGVPTLLYKLPGIPEAYYQYCFCLEDLSVAALSNKMAEVLYENPVILNDIGLRARNFILTMKNPIEQSKKVIDIINLLK